MPARVYKTDKELLLTEGKIIVSSTDDAKFQHKVEMVNLVLGGMTSSVLSQFVYESKNTITLWVKIADEKGFDALRVKKQAGRPRKLSASDLASIILIFQDEVHFQVTTSVTMKMDNKRLKTPSGVCPQ